MHRRGEEQVKGGVTSQRVGGDIHGRVTSHEGDTSDGGHSRGGGVAS